MNNYLYNIYIYLHTNMYLYIYISLKSAFLFWLDGPSGILVYTKPGGSGRL